MSKPKSFLLIFFFVGLFFGSIFLTVTYTDAKKEVESAIKVLDEHQVDYSVTDNMRIFKKRDALREVYIDYLEKSSILTTFDTEQLTEDQIVEYEEFSKLYKDYIENFKLYHDYQNTNKNVNNLENIINNIYALEEYLMTIDNVEVSISIDSKGVHYGYNEEYEMAAASTIKVLVSLAVIDAINNGEVSPDQFVKYDRKRHYESGAGYYQTVDNFTGATVWELVEKMIVYSDNIAWKMLYDVVSKEEVFNYYTNLTGKEMTYTNTAYMTTKDLNIIMTELYNHKDEPYYNDVFKWLGETENQTRIYAASQYEVHHKVGDLYVDSVLYTNDTAIVMAPQPYIISIMIEGEDYDVNEEIIEEIIYVIEE